MKRRREIILACDRLWSKLICNKFNGRCIICGRPGSDAHHWAFGRSILKYRWNLNNGVWMCRSDHAQVEHDLGEAVLREISTNRLLVWEWREYLLDFPPLEVEPFPTYKIEEQYELLKSEALKAGLPQ